MVEAVHHYAKEESESGVHYVQAGGGASIKRWRRQRASSAVIIRFAILLRMMADDHKAFEKKSEKCIEEAFTILC